MTQHNVNIAYNIKVKLEYTKTRTNVLNGQVQY